MKKSDVLVVVVSYENPQLTIQTVQSLCAQSIPVDVVLWDNASSSNTQALLTSASFSGNVTKVMHSKNLLWTPAINEAMNRYADGYQYIGFMNNDISLSSNTIEHLLELLQYKEVGMVGPMGANLGGVGDYATHMQAAFAVGTNELDFQNRGPIRGTYLVGACCFLRKEVWDEVGPLPDDMPLGADDHWYSVLLKDAGYQIWADPRNPANHIGHASRQSPNWGLYGGVSWEAFNDKMGNWKDSGRSYYRTRTEAILCHWHGLYTPGWDKGTGAASEDVVLATKAERESLHESNMKIPRYAEHFNSGEWEGF